ncbi:MULTISPECIES: rhomboid family intramembrane serine protease [unclassified Pseudoalteromonas]|uniref:rhomboid family intramembrane serine protease n=1 Tax=unclassified Pseudoalteromonas TaxID=194690 RepID=UPI002096DD2F|nr:rhomboid family intramembrane serine protease [Pseudoalteromonas sp. XMcav2-N]MCO7188378.1 rhomboid family intramembrane serine protease [Pseudoalteromonas sp. XMcav2-N]
MSKRALVFPANFKLVLYAMAVMILVQLLGSVIGLPVGRLGIIPHNEYYLSGIITAPFVHGSWGHLMSNLVGLTISGYLAARLPKFKSATLLILVTTGLFVWLFAGSGNHIGASGLVMGYFGLLLGAALFNRNVLAVLSFIALLILTYYANISFLATLFDFSAQTSSSSHIFGFLSGLGAAYLTRASRKRVLNK